MADNSAETKAAKNKLNFSMDLRVILLVLLAVIAGMLVIWKPWHSSATTNERTVKVTGEATIKAEPDEFVFYPSYQSKSPANQANLAELTKQTDEIVAKLKTLGVADDKIKVTGSSFSPYLAREGVPDTSMHTTTIEISVTSREQAQKIQDYLLTTTPTGAITPNATFSETKRKELESKARDLATKDARTKADQSAKNLGFKVGGVKSVEDGAGFGEIFPLSMAVDSTSGASAKLGVQPGQNNTVYTVTVTYYVR